jgi:uncharacterized membrane protein YhaH (DUF805 family)
MGFAESIRTCLNKYFDFNGRASRPEFWWFFLAQSVVWIVLDVLYRTTGSAVIAIVELAAVLALLFPALAVGARRLHDTDRTGWWQLLDLVPILGFIVLVIFMAKRGDDGPNRFGEQPMSVDTSV